MKRLIGLGILGLLLSGCNVTEKKDREHEVICFNPTTHQETFAIVTPHNVLAFVVKGHSVLAYRDEDEKVQIIPLVKNDCWIY